MRVVLICRDKPGSLPVRIANRTAHLAHIETSGIVEMAGPLLDEADQMCGSLIILQVADLQAAKDWAAADPYGLAGLFESVTIKAWKKVIG